MVKAVPLHAKQVKRGCSGEFLYVCRSTLYVTSIFEFITANNNLHENIFISMK
jgi:hypothetical protein